MSINNILLICAALLPAIVLCIYVFKMDRADKEPIGLLLGLLALGAVSCLPAGILEELAFGVINIIFSPFFFEEAGEIYMPDAIYTIYNGVTNFIGVALIEEGLKFLVLFLVTRKNKNFNSLFDGLIYAVFVSLGFAAFENVLYVLRYGWGNALARALTSVPAHMFFSVLMGYYYSMWHVYEKAKNQERQFKMMGLIPPFAVEYSGGKYLTLSFFIPIVIHGLYDYYCNMETIWSTLVFIAFVVGLYIYCFRKIHQLSKCDVDDITYTNYMVFSKYPGLYERIIEINSQNNWGSY